MSTLIRVFGFVFQGNFAQFLEGADSVVSLTASEGSSGSFVNLFALTELKVGEKREGGRLVFSCLDGAEWDGMGWWGGSGVGLGGVGVLEAMFGCME